MLLSELKNLIKYTRKMGISRLSFHQDGEVQEICFFDRYRDQQVSAVPFNPPPVIMNQPETPTQFEEKLKKEMKQYEDILFRSAG